MGGRRHFVHKGHLRTKVELDICIDVSDRYMIVSLLEYSSRSHCQPCVRSSRVKVKVQELFSTASKVSDKG
jgi:hypothetical protein